MLIFQLRTFILCGYWKMFMCFIFQITHCFCHAVRYCSTSTPLLSERSVIAPVSLSPPPFLKSLVCSDWSAFTGLSRHRPLYILVSSVGAFFNDILLRGTADSTFVTSQPYEKSWQLVL